MAERRSVPDGILNFPPGVSGSWPSWSGSFPQAFRPWNDEPLTYRCATMHFDWNTDNRGEAADSDLQFPQRVARAAPRRRAEWAAGRRCAGEALRLLTGEKWFPGMAPDRSPIWPEGIVGSISHSTNSAIAMVARSTECRGIGIDLERVLNEADAGEIARQTLTPAERSRFGAGIDPFLVTLAFSAKESLFKALYPTLRRPLSFHTSEMVAWSAERGRALLRLDDDLARMSAAGPDIAVRFMRLGDLALTSVQL